MGMVDAGGATDPNTREWCDYGDMHQDECHHCDPSERTATPRSQHDIWVDRIRRQVFTAELNAATTNVMPLQRIRTERVVSTSTPQWNPGNIAAQIGGHLAAIEGMFAALSEEAQTRHSDRELPGGDALVMLAPGADIEAFGYRQLSALFGRTDADSVEVDDLETPLALLASWEDVLREERDQPTYLKASISGAAKYIRDSIEWMLSYDENGDMRFIAIDDLADQLGKVRRQMENILKDGARAHLTRVHCIVEDCDAKPRLMKMWSARVEWDAYKCPGCDTRYDKAQYEMAKAQALWSKGAARFISQIEASDAAEVPLTTVSSWAARDNVQTQRDPDSGSLLVWWPDVRHRALERAERLKAVGTKRQVKKAEEEAEARVKEAAERKAKYEAEKARHGTRTTMRALPTLTVV